MSACKILCLFILISFSSCEKKTDTVEYIIDSFATDRYYSGEIFNVAYLDIYHKWRLYGISGGFHGGGHDPNFDFLKINRYGIYSFIRNDSTLEYGKIIVHQQTDNLLLISLEPDDDSETFMYDSEKYVNFYGSDTLSLDSPCCDRYNYHFTRE
jgi:hypothetical protein